jgi:hypothetical protein
MDPGDQTVRLEFAVKQGVRPFGPQLLANQRFSLDASFREFFFSKRTFRALPGGHLFLFQNYTSMAFADQATSDSHQQRAVSAEGQRVRRKAGAHAAEDDREHCREAAED